MKMALTDTRTHKVQVGEQHTFFFDGYCSTVQGLLDWFEVDLGFTRAFIYSNRFVCSVCFCSPLVLRTFCTASPARWECL